MTTLMVRAFLTSPMSLGAALGVSCLPTVGRSGGLPRGAEAFFHMLRLPQRLVVPLTLASRGLARRRRLLRRSALRASRRCVSVSSRLLCHPMLTTVFKQPASHIPSVPSRLVILAQRSPTQATPEQRSRLTPVASPPSQTSKRLHCPTISALPLNPLP